MPSLHGSLRNNHLLQNVKARLFPEFYFEARDESGRAVAYLRTVPAYWSGETQSLQDLTGLYKIFNFGAWTMLKFTLLYLLAIGLLRSDRLFDAMAARFRKRVLDGCNSIVLVAMTVDPEHQGQRMPSLILEEVRRTARRLGWKNILSPFRPNGYGDFKAARAAAHSDELFEHYVNLRTAEGLPVDPWMRSIARNGGRFLRIERRSVTFERSIECFERFRKSYRPDQWYSPAPDVWECGETPTWYVDRGRKVVRSVESNIWGQLPVDQPAWRATRGSQRHTADEALERAMASTSRP